MIIEFLYLPNFLCGVSVFPRIFPGLLEAFSHVITTSFPGSLSSASLVVETKEAERETLGTRLTLSDTCVKVL